MSVIIKDFKIPAGDGPRTFLTHFNDDGTAEMVAVGYPQKRYSLIEVPPHGDLIDAFAFRREMDTNYPFDKFTQSKHGEADAAKSTILMMLAKAPIIIEAEEAKENAN